MFDKDNFINKAINNAEYSFTNSQNEALTLFANFLDNEHNEPNLLFLLKGYAGTGKTSLISSIVKTLPLFGVQSVLMAPTGRAAKVFANYSSKACFTIHRSIYNTSITEDNVFSFKLAKNYKSNTVFIVDEASMIAINNTDSDNFNRSVMSDLIEYVCSGENCKLLLLGDVAQLPPVGVEDSFILNKEFLEKNYNIQITEYELKDVVRQHFESGILFNATVLRKLIFQNTIKLPLFNKSFNDIKVLNGFDFEDYLNSCYSKYGYENCVVITRSNKRANLFNNEIRKSILCRETEISVGDIIIITKNNYFWAKSYQKINFIANGDMAEIRRINGIEERYGLRFADVSLYMFDYPSDELIDVKIILDSMVALTPNLSTDVMKELRDDIVFDFSEIDNKPKAMQLLKQNEYYNALQAKFAYSLTCHKTQGGQWDSVFVEQGFLSENTLDTNYLRWLYTAITRAKSELYFINFNEQFFIDN